MRLNNKTMFTIMDSCQNAQTIDSWSRKLYKKTENGDFDWFIDSGATSHMTKTDVWIRNMRKDSGKIVAANKSELKVIGSGTVLIHPDNVKFDTILIEDVKVVPGLALNLLSVSQMIKKGLRPRLVTAVYV